MYNEGFEILKGPKPLAKERCKYHVQKNNVVEWIPDH